MPVPRIGRLSLAVFALRVASGAAAPAQAEAAAEVLSPLVATPLTSPNPVPGSDDKTHLAYEFMLVNMAPSVLTVEKVETLDAASGAVLGSLSGEALAQMLKLNGGAKGAAILQGRVGFGMRNAFWLRHRRNIYQMGVREENDAEHGDRQRDVEATRTRKLHGLPLSST